MKINGVNETWLDYENFLYKYFYFGKKEKFYWEDFRHIEKVLSFNTHNGFLFFLYKS